jgi:hypothetical protein
MAGDIIGSTIVAGGMTYKFTRPLVGIPFQAPPLPTYFIPRPEAVQPVKERLLAEPGGVLAISALYGLGGIGKSMLAAALAYDAEVQARFKDGVLWATWPAARCALAAGRLIQALQDYQFHALDVEAASAHLRTLLRDKACLLVVDDAWKAEHVLPFLAGGEGCRVLLTTRQALVAGAAEAEVVELQAMTEAQALALLGARLPQPLADAARQEALLLAHQLGYLPLALELAAAQVADGMDWAELRQALEAEASLRPPITRPRAVEAPGTADSSPLGMQEADFVRQKLGLETSLALSLRHLSPERRAAFAWLGVLPEDAVLNPKMAATLWDLPDETQASSLLVYLRDRALLLPGSPYPNGEPSFRVHELPHNLARALLTAPVIPAQRSDLPGLGLLLPQANALLLGRYRARCAAAPAAAPWHTLPNDAYIHARLVWHMRQAGWVAEVHALLREETAAGHNAWFEARHRLGQVDGYLEDVRRGWDMARQSASPFAAQGGLEIGLQIRYALTLATLNNLAASIPPELLDALVKYQLWPPEQGLAHARQKPNPFQKSLALSALVKYLPATQQEVVLAEGLSAARRAAGAQEQAQALAALAPHLSPPLLDEALATARQFSQEDGGSLAAPALSALATRLAQVGRSDEALAVVAQIAPPRAYAQALAALAPHLSPAALSEALALARQITIEGEQALALLGLAPYLPTVAVQGQGAISPAARVITESLAIARRWLASADWYNAGPGAGAAHSTTGPGRLPG